MPAEEPTTVYRFFDADGRLLYVGVTNDTGRRTQQHRQFAPWWDVATSCQFERYPSRLDALEAEATAIRAEHPIHNHNSPPPEYRNIIGEKRLISMPELWEGALVWVIVHDVRVCYGRLDYLIQPVMGEGEAWVSAERVTVL